MPVSLPVALERQFLDALQRDDTTFVQQCGLSVLDHVLGKSGNTMLHLACAKQKVANVRALLEAAANVSAVNIHGDCPLHFACHSGAAGIAGLLLRAGADTSARNADGTTPLMCAAGGGHTVTLQLLLRTNTQLDVGDESNRTALHFAAAGGHLECCQELLAAGASCTVRSRLGLTPLTEALQRKPVDPELCKLLREHAPDADVLSEDETEPDGRSQRRRRRRRGEAVVVPAARPSPCDEREQSSSEEEEAQQHCDDELMNVVVCQEVPEGSGDPEAVWKVASSRRSRRQKKQEVVETSMPAANLSHLQHFPELVAAPPVAEPVVAAVDNEAAEAALATTVHERPQQASDDWLAFRRAHLPELDALDMHVSALCGQGLSTLSAAQLDALFAFHRDQLNAVVDAQIALARVQGTQEAVQELSKLLKQAMKT